MRYGTLLAALWSFILLCIPAGAGEQEDTEWLIQLDEGPAWRAVRVSPAGQKRQDVRIQIEPPFGPPPPLTRLAVLRNGNLLGFVRIKNSYHGFFVVGSIAESLEPSKITNGDVLKQFKMTHRKKKPLPELTKREERAVKKAASRLGHSSFRTRENATAFLKPRGKEILPYLEGLTESPDPEVRLRAKEITSAILNRERTVSRKRAKVLARWQGGPKPPKEQGFLGIKMSSVDEGGVSGVLVLGIIEDAPAEKIGLQRGDIVLSVDGEKLRETLDLMDIVASKKPGTKIKLKILREKKNLEFETELIGRPENPKMK